MLHYLAYCEAYFAEYFPRLDSLHSCFQELNINQNVFLLTICRLSCGQFVIDHLKLNNIQSDSKFSLNYIQPDSNQIIFKQILVEK